MLQFYCEGLDFVENYNEANRKLSLKQIDKGTGKVEQNRERQTKRRQGKCGTFSSRLFVHTVLLRSFRMVPTNEQSGAEHLSATGCSKDQ